MQKKSTVDEIRERFDNDVERFSNLETGQAAAIDAPIALELISQAAHLATPGAKDLLDIGCGAGNFSLRVLTAGDYSTVTLVDLSRNMLDRAEQRISATNQVEIHCHPADVRDIDLAVESFDVVLAGAVLHHLRSNEEWEDVFKKISSGCVQAVRFGFTIW